MNAACMPAGLRAVGFFALTVLFSLPLAARDGQDEAGPDTDVIVYRNTKGKVTGVLFICREGKHDAEKAKPGGGSGGGDGNYLNNNGTGYSLLDKRWNVDSINVTLYTQNPQNLLEDSAVPSDYTVKEALMESFIVWNAADAVAPRPPTVNFTTITGMTPVFALGDGVNTVSWQNLRWLGKRTLAATWVQDPDGDGIIDEIDIAFMTWQPWALYGGSPGFESSTRQGTSFDIQAIGSHEVGHAVGLGHSTNDLELTMYPSASSGTTHQRSLSQGDKDGVNANYPNP